MTISRSPNYVKVQELAKRVEQIHIENNISWCELARRCGYSQIKEIPDTSRLKRRLGLQPDNNRVNKHIDVNAAIEICRALDIDPIDVGL